MIVSVALSPPVGGSFLRPFDLGTPAVTRQCLRTVPCILLSGLSSPHHFVVKCSPCKLKSLIAIFNPKVVRGENPDSNVQPVV